MRLFSVQKLFPILSLLGIFLYSLFLLPKAEAQQFGDQRVITTKAAGAKSVHTADLTGDGSPDVISAWFDEISWYENEGGGSFSDQRTVGKTDPYWGSDVDVSDIDGDKKKDIVSVSWYFGTDIDFNSIRWTKIKEEEISLQRR